MKIISTLDWVLFAIKARIANTSTITSDLDFELIAYTGILVHENADEVCESNFGNIQKIDEITHTPKCSFYSDREICL